MGEENNDESQ